MFNGEHLRPLMHVDFRVELWRFHLYYTMVWSGRLYCISGPCVSD